MTDPYGNTIPIDITDDAGYIKSPYAEYAAVTMTSTDGGTYGGDEYVPYTYPVQETGVYTFEFHSYDKTGATNPNSNKRRSAQWPTSEQQTLSHNDTPSATWSSPKTDEETVTNADGSTTEITTKTQTRTVRTEYECKNYIERRKYTIETKTTVTSVTTKDGVTTKNETEENTTESYKYDNYTDSGAIIAALNLTVFDENGNKQTGRTYADFLSLQMGDVNDGVKDAYYVLTKDSFIYKMQFNGASPYTYNFFANNKGIYDSSTGEIIYTSVKDINNDNTFAEMGAAYKYPGTKDTDMLKSYYIFLEYPDDQLEGYLYEKAVQPDPATNLRFVSTVNVGYGKVPGAYVGAGGYFAFDVEEATTATLRLEFSGTSFTDKGTFAPVEISGAVTPHSTNYFYWDGKDGNGKVIPVGEYDIKDLAFTVTTKAGEIHFPILDMENAKNGITFTRLSHIYSKDGERLDSDENIYGKTKNVIYYDDTAIYYGEPAASTGYSEHDMTLVLDTKNNTTWKTYPDVNNAVKNYFDSNPGKYWTYNNMRPDNSGGEYNARKDYLSNPLDDSTLRVGDHSHTTNVIDYFDDKGNLLGDSGAEDITEEQLKMIDYLDSKKFPVGKASSTSVYYENCTTGAPTRPEDQNSNNEDNGYHWKNVQSAQTTTDYAIANFWTFIPSQPAFASTDIENIEIVAKPDDSFDLTGRVFFDVLKDGVFNDMTTDGDYPLKDVTLNLYKKKDTAESYNSDNEYVEYKDGKIAKLTEDNYSAAAATGNVYKLIDSGLTTGEGVYRFTGLDYDPINGTDYLYEVIKPGSSYSLTSKEKNASAIYRENGSVKQYYGYYADKSYNNTYKGTEVQQIKVGGSGGVDPTKYGYNSYNNSAKPDGNVAVCAVDVGYNYTLMAKSLTAKKKWAGSVETDSSPTSVVYEVKYDTDTTKNQLYNFWTVSPITAWQNEDEYLPANQSGAVTDYYVSAEYYIKGGYIYRHQFVRKASGDDYESFVGATSRVKCEDLYTGDYADEKPTEAEGYTFLNLPDLNGDGSRNAWDLVEIEDWETVDENDAPYRAVLDKNETASGTEITVTNSENHGTIEIFKYHDSNEEANALQGATFRVYEGEMDKVKAAIEGGETITPVGEGTTRSNGRVAFPDLDPDKTYTVYERFAPDGYRILERYHQVVPNGKKDDITDEADKALTVEFNSENYARLDIGNAIADTEFKIRKQITGRAWQSDDSFDFTITPMFDEYSTEKTGFVLDSGENDIFGGSGGAGIDDREINNFATGITSDNKNKVTIDYKSDYYSYTSKRPGGSGEYTITSSTEKVSVGLLVDGKDETAKASFCNEVFPYAGVYTFEIKENEPAADANNTLTYTSRVYTVQIKVVRELNATEEGGAIKTEANTHLVASVDSVTYRDTPTDSEQVFAGSSPVFVNEYHPAPAVQSTTYAIQKVLSGRNWVNTAEVKDTFTINVKAVDATTTEAINANQLNIYGFEYSATGAVKANTEGNGWVCTFTTASNANIPFTAFVFNNIEFPVKFVHNTTNAVEEPDPEWEPDSDKMKEFLGTHTAKTEPVEYWLDIFEEIPVSAAANGNKDNGITYDTQHYYLHITLRNAEQIVSGGDLENEEEDGIIDEIDMALYHAEQTDNVSSLTGAVATCFTKAEVLKDSEWIKDETPPEGGTYDWFYIDDTGKLIKDDTHASKPANAKLLVRRWEKHDGVHLMTITNNYSAETTWALKVEKELVGRTWRTSDEFKFTISEDDNNEKTGYTMPADATVTIKNDTDDHTAQFGSITFTKPGEYIFEISETAHTGGVSITPDEPVYIQVTVTDNYDGTLSKEFSFVEFDAEGNPVPVEGKTYTETDVITLTNTYSDNPKEFALAIQKTLIGRNWKTDDNFTFTITPDDDTKKAITDGRLIMPTTLKSSSTGGAYTAEIAYADGSGTIEDVITKALGKISINSLPADVDSAEYKFTITEDIDDFEGKMLCRHDTVTLIVKVERDMTDGIPNGKLNVSATYTIDGDKTTCFVATDSDPTATIPFENICLGTLTVEKEVVSSNEDTTEFDFTVEFKFVNSDGKFTAPEIEKITAALGSVSVKPTVSIDGLTYTYKFNLKHGEKITFSNILPNTTYTITEGTEPDNYMFLRIMDKDGNNVYKEDDGQTASGEIIIDDSPYEYTFISGKIHNLPSAGGTGTRLIMLGGLALIIASALFYTLFHKNEKRREAR